MMWVVAEYEATSLFSLKATTATSSGGKTLLVPTPFALKMALLDVACRTEGVACGRQAWQWLRSLKVALRPTRYAVVSNVFTKMLKPKRGQSKEGYADFGPLQRTIGYREYAQLVGPFGLAVGHLSGADAINSLCHWLGCVSYLGKRGGFVQICSPPSTSAELPAGYIEVTNAEVRSIPLGGIMHLLDDCDASVPFERVDIYSGKSLRRDKDRVPCHVVLPYRVRSSSRGYTLYERIDE